MGRSFSIAGAHLKCYVNGKLLGYVMGVPSWQVRTDWGELREIDSVIARQLAPRMYAVMGTLQILRGRETGGPEGAGMVPQAEAMLRQKYLTIEIQDRVTQDIVYRAILCQVLQQDWQIQPKSLVVGSVNFRGITFANEATQ
jgi:hypothetical protein